MPHRAARRPISGERSGLALSPDGRQLVVSQQGAPSQWIFIDAASLTVTGRIPAPEGQNARRAVFGPDGATVYLVAGTDSTALPPARLHVADAASRSVVGAIDLPANVSLDDLAATPDGGLLVGAGSGFLHSIDGRSGTYGGRALVARPASDPAGPRSANFRRLAMDPGGARVYAATVNDIAVSRRSIGVFDVRSLDLVDQIFVREPPDFGLPLLRISPDGRELFYAPQLGTGVQIFDLPSGVELATIAVEASFRLTELAVA